MQPTITPTSITPAKLCDRCGLPIDDVKERHKTRFKAGWVFEHFFSEDCIHRLRVALAVASKKAGDKDKPEWE